METVKIKQEVANNNFKNLYSELFGGFVEYSKFKTNCWIVEYSEEKKLFLGKILKTGIEEGVKRWTMYETVST